MGQIIHHSITPPYWVDINGDKKQTQFPIKTSFDTREINTWNRLLSICHASITQLKHQNLFNIDVFIAYSARLNMLHAIHTLRCILSKKPCCTVYFNNFILTQPGFLGKMKLLASLTHSTHKTSILNPLKNSTNISLASKFFTAVIFENLCLAEFIRNSLTKWYIIILRYQVYRYMLHLSWTMIEPITTQNQWSTGA